MVILSKSEGSHTCQSREVTAEDGVRSPQGHGKWAWLVNVGLWQVGLGAGGVGREEVGAVNKRASDTGQEDEVPGYERGQASQSAYMSTYILKAPRGWRVRRAVRRVNPAHREGGVLHPGPYHLCTSQGSYSLESTLL